MQYTYKPEGVCSYKMIIEVEEDTIKKVTIEGGCAGNTVGVSRLVEGMKIEEAIKRLKGIQCGYKGTSCPDQLAIALEEIIENNHKSKIWLDKIENKRFCYFNWGWSNKNIIDTLKKSMEICYDNIKASNKLLNPYFDDLYIINLTELFGAGNEPSKAEMDYIFKDF